MHKVFKKLVVFLSLTTFSFYTTNANVIKLQKNNAQNFNQKKIINKINLSPISYNDFISPSATKDGEENIMYYGRVLKYYYANASKISENDIKTLENNFINFKDSDKAFAIQNLIASTINISIYGASSDAEFFAEAFSKWLNTPDAQKNKSWEITNNFFIKIFPEILKEGGLLKNQQKRICNIIEKNKNKELFYDTTITINNISQNSVDLKYQLTNFTFSNYWRSLILNKKSALKNISNQFKSYNDYEFDNAYSVVKGWMFDSYTPASVKSIESFNSFNTNKYSNFESLDADLVKNSIAKDGVSRLPFKKVYDNLGEFFEKQTFKNSNDLKKWVSNDTHNLKELTLFLYNILFSLIQNESWVKNLINGFIVSPDFPLVAKNGKNMSNVMGYYRSSASRIGAKQMTYESTAYSYIVLSGKSLAYKDFSSQYTSGFWSAPGKFNTLIHEYGHALDGLGSKLNIYRNSKYQSDIYYKDMYSGNIFGDYIPSAKKGFILEIDAWIISIVMGVGILASTTLIFFIYRSSKKKS